MAKSCNGIGCNGAWDCDNCRQTHDCDQRVTCDLCDGDCGDTWYEIDGDDICEDCLNNEYKRSF